MIKELRNKLKQAARPEYAANLQRFFKTGPGEYGEGDVFMGLKMPTIRKTIKDYTGLPMSDILSLLQSKYHEERMSGLLILVAQYEKLNKKTAQKEYTANEIETKKKKIVDFYLQNWRAINNWDLVDLTAPNILGDYFRERDKKTLYRLAHSKNLWQKRIAMLATAGFIRQNEFEDALQIAEILLFDEHDLIHKAVGWMLREIGKRDLKVEEKFLKKHYKKIPRTALRYAIERFAEPKRQFYLNS